MWLALPLSSKGKVLDNIRVLFKLGQIMPFLIAYTNPVPLTPLSPYRGFSLGVSITLVLLHHYVHVIVGANLQVFGIHTVHV